MTPEFVLYSTWGCHLCEKAEQMLLQAGMAGRFQVIDIVDHPDVFEQYRLLIPVIACINSKATLDWPFGQEQLQAWLQHCVIKDLK
ncbi:glutaredoxin family protein [Alkalimonas collagenimarina]|uniref:Glutaredoxin family protein n=1 Tax=Alkalimonas collagenimarina TaxID=400390 RepID=A0ABT9GW24_9GAMM|nr:glutaredoxin family protein [Alkalimonas collagenimarina]MDP4535250.1 glutaredoxin family protein [Alkalimonas collagenimarina]